MSLLAQKFVYLSEALLYVMRPFKFQTVSYELTEHLVRGRFLVIRMRFANQRELMWKISLDPWLIAYPDEMPQILAEQFKYHFDRFYIEPDDHIVLGTE